MINIFKSININNIEMNNDFKYSLPDLINEQDDEYQKILEKEIESQCGMVYKNKIDTSDDISDEELIKKTKEEIIEYKNSKMRELKAYIASLEQEKDDLIDNFKDTTNLLLEKIKDLESKTLGFRPETPMIAKNLRKKKGVTKEDFGFVNGNDPLDDVEDIDTTDNKKKPKKKNEIQHCPNCGGYFPESEFLSHSLQCLRKVFNCKVCGVLVDESKKTQHLKENREPNLLISAINANNEKQFLLCLDHGFNYKKTIDSNGNFALHLICQNNRVSMLKTIFERMNRKDEIKTLINNINKDKDTALSLAVSSKSVDCVKLLLDKGADVSIRNKSDSSPLMISCKIGSLNIMKELLNHGANVNEKNILGDTPLKIAQMNGNSELAMVLMKEYKAKIK